VPRAIAVLLPPSEGKAEGGSGPPWRPGPGVLPVLDASRAQVLAALDPAGRGVAAAPTLPALRRYTGVLYRELDAASLPPAARRRLRATALVFSGLWGVVGATDPIPDYRLKMGARVGDLGRLATWWRPRLTEALRPRLAGRVVWDLLPQEHAAAWDPGAVPVARRITVRFVTAEGATISHWNKLLKGALVRHLAETGLADPAGLAAFDHPAGYRFDAEASDLGAATATVVLRGP
jgi:cytoplasmic iron level regulating protein YaaA (DUF328/UPF0246 family)